MPHFFVSPQNISGNRFVLSGPEAHHLYGVRRIRPGDLLHLFDGTGKAYVGKIEAASGEEINGIIIEQSVAPSASIELDLYQSVPKGDRFDWLVEKAAELGVASVTPLVTERSVIKEFSAAKIERWKRLSLAASQQSGRPTVLRLGNPLPFREAVAVVQVKSVGILPWEGEDARDIDDVLVQGVSGSVAVFIGPEGGFAMREVSHARDNGVAVVTLGSRILRVETAGLLASVLILHHFKEFSTKVAG